MSIRDSLVLNLLATLVAVQKPCPGEKLWPYSAQFFRETLKRYMGSFRLADLNLKPYSLRRGGATYLLQCRVPLDVLLLRGRWRSLSVARLYLQDGLAQIPHLRINSTDTDRLVTFAAKRPETTFRP